MQCNSWAGIYEGLHNWPAAISKITLLRKRFIWAAAAGRACLTPSSAGWAGAGGDIKHLSAPLCFLMRVHSIFHQEQSVAVSRGWAEGPWAGGVTGTKAAPVAGLGFGHSQCVGRLNDALYIHLNINFKSWPPFQRAEVDWLSPSRGFESFVCYFHNALMVCAFSVWISTCDWCR